MTKQKSFGVYGETEMKWMGWIHRFKGRVFEPVARGLTSMGVTPNGLSILGAAVAAVGFVLSFWLGEAWWFVGGIFGHLIIDSFDGTLARYQKNMSLQGSYVDVIFDHVVIVMASVFAFYFMGADFVGTLLYTVFYTFVNGAAFVLSCAGKPLDFVVRPRLFLYGIFVIDLIAGTGGTFVMIYVMTIAMAASVIEGGLRLKRLL